MSTSSPRLLRRVFTEPSPITSPKRSTRRVVLGKQDVQPLRKKDENEVALIHLADTVRRFGLSVSAECVDANVFKSHLCVVDL